MAKITLERRNKLAGSQFALPGQRKYPIPDKSHAANAKVRAAQQVGKSITAEQKEAIDRKADQVMKKDPDKSQRMSTSEKKVDPDAKGRVYKSTGI